MCELVGEGLKRDDIKTEKEGDDVRPRDKKEMETNLGYLTSPLQTFFADSLKSSTTTPEPAPACVPHATKQSIQPPKQSHPSPKGITPPPPTLFLYNHARPYA
ncbi:unnamed protein product [Sphenostylis stenocarpa]|uniref:Uncharacterized protein n=1 Tax=Sphenostylis stenocarpa TaxID=92480 RepID=A0AA86SLT3_9FABA|nr:unnamed protein product [Sphenostylis stenocarpa]